MDYICKTCGELFVHKPSAKRKYCSLKCRKVKHGFSNRTDKILMKFYDAWRSMKNRCRNKSHRQYKDYGGRGIYYCKSWEKFENFKNDMFHEYLEHILNYDAKNTTLDKIDNNGNYCKENCKWSTYREQFKNRRCSVMITYKGKTQSITDWANFNAEKVGISARCMHYRIKTWGIHEALTRLKR